MLVSHQYLEYNGAVFQTVYGNGSAQLYHYDNRGFLTSVTYGQKAASGEISWDPTPAVTYSYSPEGRLIARSSSATAQSFAYDFLGRVIRSSTTGDGRQNHTIDQTYDSYNRLDSFTETIGQTSRTTKAFYSPTGELTGLSLSGEDSPSVLYEYDELLRLKKRTLPNGRVTEYRYLDAGPNRTTSLVSAVIEDGVALLYSYDARGNILTIKKEQGGSTSLLFEYTYDALGQLTREDDLQRHIRTQYFYDGNGNITNQNKQNITGSNVVSGELFGQATWTYGDGNWKDLLTSYNGNTIYFDELGNTTFFGGRILDWNNGRKLASVNMHTCYAYDADGLLIRITNTQSGSRTNFYRNGTLITGIEENGVLTRYFYDASGSILGFEKNGATYYYLKNLQGDVTGITDSNGGILGLYRYDAWGSLLGIYNQYGVITYSAILQENPFRYRGYYYDGNSGFYYLNSRYYSPELKRFISADSQLNNTASNLSCNLFAYCENNPISLADSNGTSPFTAIKTAIKMISSAVFIPFGHQFKEFISGTGSIYLSRKGYKIANIAFQHALWGKGKPLSHAARKKMIERLKESSPLDNLTHDLIQSASSDTANTRGSIELSGKSEADADLYYTFQHVNYDIRATRIESAWKVEITISDYYNFDTLRSFKNFSTASLANDLGWYLQGTERLTPYPIRVSYTKFIFD